MIDEKRVPIAGDTVKTTDSNEFIIVRVFEQDDRLFVQMVTTKEQSHKAQLIAPVSDLHIVEYSPMHKLAIMGETFRFEESFRFVDLGRNNTGWECMLITGDIEFIGKGNTPDEAINAVWQVWKGSA